MNFKTKTRKNVLALSLILVIVLVTLRSTTVQGFGPLIRVGVKGTVYEDWSPYPIISDAKVTLKINGYIVDTDYTDSLGEYRVYTRDLIVNPITAQLKVEKTGCETIIRNIQLEPFTIVTEDFYLIKYVQVNVQGSVTDCGHYEPIHYMEGDTQKSTYVDYDDTPNSLEGIQILLIDRYNGIVTNTFTDASGCYDTSFVSVAKGEVTVVALSLESYYYQDSDTFDAVLGTQTVIIDFSLMRNVGEAWVWNQNAREYYERIYDDWFEYQIKYQSTGALLYDQSAGMYFSDYFITTYIHSPGYDMSGYWRYATLYKTVVKIWVTNHWNGDEGFINLSESPVWDAASWGRGTVVTPTITLNIPMNPSPLSIGFSSTIGDATSFYPETLNDDVGEDGKVLGQMTIMWNKAKSKAVYLHWFLQSIIQEVMKQTGAHVTFKIEFKHEVRAVDIYTFWSDNSYEWVDVLYLGDGQTEPDDPGANFDPWYRIWPGTIEFT